MDYASLIPFVLLEIVERAGGIIEVDAKSVQQRIQVEDYKRLGFEIINGRLRIEVFEKDEGTTEKQIGKGSDKS